MYQQSELVERERLRQDEVYSLRVRATRIHAVEVAGHDDRGSVRKPALELSGYLETGDAGQAKL